MKLKKTTSQVECLRKRNTQIPQKKIRSLFVKSEVEVEVDLRKRNGLNIWPVEKKHEWE